MRCSFLFSMILFLGSSSYVFSQSPGDVLINEVVTDPQQDWSSSGFDGTVGIGAVNSDDDWVELYMVTSGLDLTNWTIELNDGTDVSGTLTAGGAFTISNYIPSGGGSFTSTQPGDYLVLGNISTGAINQSVTVVLRESTGVTIIDQVEIASGSGTGFTGNASSLDDESVVRIPNGVDTDVEADDFVLTRATLGTSNSPTGIVLINEVITDPQQDWSTNGFNGTPNGLGGSTGTDEWIELYIGTTGLNLTKWTIEVTDGGFFDGDLSDDASGAFQETTYFGSGSFVNTQVGDYLVLGNPEGSESMTNDVYIVLKDADGNIIDDVEIGDDPEADVTGDGAPDGGAGGGDATGISDESISRDGVSTDTDNDIDDFRKLRATMGAPNGLNTVYVDAAAADDTGLGSMADPKQLVSSAVEFLINGGTVIVAAGTYAESVVIDRPLTLQGANQGTAATGTRVAESIIDPGSSNTAITISASSVTIDGFQIGGSDLYYGISSDGQTDLSIINSLVIVDSRGITIDGATTGSIDVSDNSVSLGAFIEPGGATPAAGLSLLSLAGSAVVTVSDNTFSGGFYGLFVYGCESTTPLQITNTSVSSAIQGLLISATDNTNTAPSTVMVDDYEMLSFDEPALGITNAPQAGIYIYSPEIATDADPLVVTINDARISGTGNTTSDYAAIICGDFSTASAVVYQDVTLTNSTLSGNENRGLLARGVNTELDISQTTFTNNGFDPLGAGGNQGFHLVVRNDAIVTVESSFFVNPSSQVSDDFHGLDLAGTSSSLTITNSFFDQNGNGLVASTSGINLSGNHFGSTDDTVISGWIDAGCDYTPFLANGTDTDLVTPGFQGSLSNLIVTNTGSQTGATDRIQEAYDLISTGDTVTLSLDDFPVALTAEKDFTLATLSTGADTTAIDDLTINGSGITMGLSGNLRIDNSLTMTDGNIDVADGSYLILPDGVSEPSELPNSRVIGALAAESFNIGAGTYTRFGVTVGGGTIDLGNISIVRNASVTAAVVDGPHSSIGLSWSIESDNPPTDGRDLTFSWDDIYDNGKDLTIMSLFKNEGAGWDEVDGPRDVSATGDPRTYPAFTTTSFSDWTLAQEDMPLPIDLVSFTGAYEAGEVVLNWTTATEVDVDYFEIERRTENGDFRSIATVSAVGNSRELQYYSFKDSDYYLPSYAYYRLRNVDIDGAFEYFSPIMVTKTISKESIGFYPNPAKDVIFFSGIDKVQDVQILSLTGRLLLHAELTSELDISSLPKGCYIVKAIIGLDSITEVMIKE